MWICECVLFVHDIVSHRIESHSINHMLVAFEFNHYFHCKYYELYLLPLHTTANTKKCWLIMFHLFYFSFSHSIVVVTLLAWRRHQCLVRPPPWSKSSVRSSRMCATDCKCVRVRVIENNHKKQQQWQQQWSIEIDRGILGSVACARSHHRECKNQTYNMC